MRKAHEHARPEPDAIQLQEVLQLLFLGKRNDPVRLDKRQHLGVGENRRNGLRRDERDRRPFLRVRTQRIDGSVVRESAEPVEEAEADEEQAVAEQAEEEAPEKPAKRTRKKKTAE